MSPVNCVFSAFLKVGAIPGCIVELTLALFESIFWRQINIVHVIELNKKLQLLNNWKIKPWIDISALDSWLNASTCNFFWASFCLGASWTGEIYAYSKSKEDKSSFKSCSPLSVEFKDFCSCFVDLCDSSIFNQVWAIFWFAVFLISACPKGHQVTYDQ